MKLTVKKSDIKRALDLASPCVERRTTVPVLSHVLLSCTSHGQRLSVSSSNFEVSAVATVQADVSSTGSLCAKLHPLKKVVSALPHDEITLSTEEPPSATRGGKKGANDILSVLAGKHHFEMTTLPPGDFPKLKISDRPATRDVMSADGLELKAALKMVLPAVSAEESRFQLSGALFVTEGGVWTMASTDGHRLNILEHDKTTHSSESLLIPRSAMAAMAGYRAGLLKGRGFTVRVTTGRDFVYFDSEEFTLCAKVLEGNFPEYERIVRDPPGRHCRVTQADLKAAMELVRVAGSESRYSSAAVVDMKAEKLTLSSGDRNDGMFSTSEVPVEEITALGRVGIKPEYLIEAVSLAAMVGNGSMDIHFSEDVEDGALIFRPVGLKCRRFDQVVMPLRLG